MPIVLGQNCHQAAAFVAAHHPHAFLPRNAPQPIVAPDFIVGNDFFTVTTQQELQEFIDNTYKMKKKLDFQGNLQTVQQAKTLLDRASSDSNVNITVRWGIHQSQNRPSNDPGLCKHFTIIGNPNDWHLYVNTNSKKISFMSNGGGANNLVEIKRY